ncbi:MAG: NTP transferase domain-containing protein, partial [Bacteroidetes bacterium]|nr:NTP transferase domain-containing protein [Bacteroidota bacterium]
MSKTVALMPREAVVLAGGFGTRLRSVVADLPKPMAPVRGRPFLAYVLDELLNQGIMRVVLAVGYKAEAIRDYFGDNYNGLELVYSVEEEPLGTGGGIRQAVGLCHAESVFVLNGDTYFRVSFEHLFNRFAASDSLLTIALKQMRDFDRYGTVLVNDAGVITGFREKRPMALGLINGGVYLMRTSLFALKPLPERFSFEQEILEAEYLRGRFHAEIFDG